MGRFLLSKILPLHVKLIFLNCMVCDFSKFCLTDYLTAIPVGIDLLLLTEAAENHSTVTELDCLQISCCHSKGGALRSILGFFSKLSEQLFFFF